METDTNLLNDLQFICEQLNNENYSELFTKGREKIVEFKTNGGEKEITYNTTNELRLKYEDIDEYKTWLVEDWLDCIIGGYGGQNIIWQ